MSKLVSELFQASARTEILRLMLMGRMTTSVRKLSQLCKLSYEVVRKEVEHLESLGLVTTVARGASKLVTANWDHPANRHLLALLELDTTPEHAATDTEVREALLAYGAPVLADHAQAHWTLEETLILALKTSRRYATILRVLPVVLAKNRDRLDRRTLLALAHSHQVKAELGLLLDLTGKLLHDETLKELAQSLYDKRRKRWREYPEAKNRFESELAARNHSPVAARWRIRTTMTEDSFKSLLNKHCPELMRA